jgi:hypothetical protein
VRLAPEEVHNLGGTQRGDRGGHQIAPDRLAVGEQNVTGVFALINHPPVAGKAGARDVRQQRIDQGRLALEGQAVWANRSHTAATAALSSTAVILLSLRRYPIAAASSCCASPSSRIRLWESRFSDGRLVPRF